jgi:hypothetical protein
VQATQGLDRGAAISRATRRAEAGDRFELVFGFHRIAGRPVARPRPGVGRRPSADTDDADRAVENITSCRRRHDVINADRVVMPMSELKAPRFVVNPVARSA